jgi:RNA polymerase sigma-70 factor (ECF subfamily)
MDALLARSPLMQAPPEAMQEPTGQQDGNLAGQAGTDAASHAAAEGLARARAGDPQGFRMLVRLHQARVYSVAMRFTGRHAEAEELAQDVFVQLHGALAQIEGPAHLKHWLLRTVSHRCIDRVREAQRRPRLVSISQLQDAPEAHAPESGGDPLAGARLRRLLLQLADDARAVVLLRYQEDLDPVDIAAALGMSINTVKSHLRRSLDWLRAQYHGDNHGY